jgi:CBS domain-containing protein
VAESVELFAFALVQVPPVSMDPSVSLEAIFSLMNNMAIEIVPIVSTGGIYHGLLTRTCMMRFQSKLVADEDGDLRR